MIKIATFTWPKGIRNWKNSKWTALLVSITISLLTGIAIYWPWPIVIISLFGISPFKVKSILSLYIISCGNIVIPFLFPMRDFGLPFKTKRPSCLTVSIRKKMCLKKRSKNAPIKLRSKRHQPIANFMFKVSHKNWWFLKTIFSSLRSLSLRLKVKMPKMIQRKKRMKMSTVIFLPKKNGSYEPRLNKTTQNFRKNLKCPRVVKGISWSAGISAVPINTSISIIRSWSIGWRPLKYYRNDSIKNMTN